MMKPQVNHTKLAAIKVKAGKLTGTHNTTLLKAWARRRDQGGNGWRRIRRPWPPCMSMRLSLGPGGLSSGF